MTASNLPGGKIRVLIVDDIVETRDNVKKLLYFEKDIDIVGTASNGREGVELALKLQPDIVLMDINMPEMDGIAASEAISAKAPNTQVVMMSVQGEADYLRRSMLAGAREYLIKPFTSDELIKSLRRVYQLASTRRIAAPPPPPPPTAPAPLPPPPKRGKVIAIFGAKGGCGATTLAVNLAVALREETAERVALIDGNLEFGDAGVMLNLPQTRTIADLVGGKGEIDEEVLDGTMTSHSSGIKILLAPARPELAETVKTDHLKRILDLMAKSYDYIVVDVWKSFQESTIFFLDAADTILLLCTADITAIKNAKLFFELTEKLEYPPEKTVLILSKEDNRSGINPKDIAASIKHPVSGIIPRDERTATTALNRGIPFIIAQRNLPLSQTVFALARTLARTRAEETASPKAAAARR